jgi:hypothetical protein
MLFVNADVDEKTAEAWARQEAVISMRPILARNMKVYFDPPFDGVRRVYWTIDLGEKE